MEKMKRIASEVHIGGTGEEEEIETSELNEPVFYPDTEETREEFKGVFEVSKIQETEFDRE